MSQVVSANNAFVPPPGKILVRAALPRADWRMGEEGEGWRGGVRELASMVEALGFFLGLGFRV